MIASPLTTPASAATPLPLGHYCPVCLRRVRPAQAHRRPHREACASGPLDVSLLCCPTCGLTLAAQPVTWVQADA